MKDTWDKTVAGFKVWKLAWLKVFLASTATGAMAFQTAMSGGIEWDKLNGTDKTLVLVGVYAVMAGVVIAFLDRTIGNIEAGEKEKKDDENTKIFLATKPKQEP